MEVHCHPAQDASPLDIVSIPLFHFRYRTDSLQLIFISSVWYQQATNGAYFQCFDCSMECYKRCTKWRYSYREVSACWVTVWTAVIDSYMGRSAGAERTGSLSEIFRWRLIKSNILADFGPMSDIDIGSEYFDVCVQNVHVELVLTTFGCKTEKSTPVVLPVLPDSTGRQCSPAPLQPPSTNTLFTQQLSALQSKHNYLLNKYPSAA